MKINVYNQKGEKAGNAELSSKVFGLKTSIDLLRQVAISQMANKRQGTAHSKDRSEVRGGGKKPWKQKGTGRARHGSNRSPIWVGGGISFGPRNNRVYKKDIPAKMRRKALLVALSGKAQDGQLILIDKLSLNSEKPNTKEMAKMLINLPCNNGTVLVILPELNKNLILSFRNLPDVSTIQAKDLNVLEVLKYKYVVMPKESAEVIEKVFVD